MANIIRWLVPKEKKLFEMLAEQSENVLEGAKELKNFVDNYEKFERSERKSKANAIKTIEHKNDEITHRIIERLNKAFITSIDKEYIRQIAILLDDVIDLINAAALRFVLLSIERIDDYIVKLVGIIHSAAIELNKTVLDFKKTKNIKEHCAKIRSLENEADNVYHEALSELFHFYRNSIDIIKYKEIYELLEEITDKCKDAANVIESAAAKRA